MGKPIGPRNAEGRFNRRQLLVGSSAAAVAAIASVARSDDSGQMQDTESMQVVQRGGLYANLHDPKISELPPSALTQRFTYSPAPRADLEGRWTEAPPLPIPRSEMAWAAAEDDRMHIIGGYAEQQVARPGSWRDARGGR